jgi:hypothetical protein
VALRVNLDELHLAGHNTPAPAAIGAGVLDRVLQAQERTWGRSILAVVYKHCASSQEVAMAL